MVNIPLSLGLHPRWLFGMSSINSTAPDLLKSQGLATVPQVPQIPQMQAPVVGVGMWLLRWDPSRVFFKASWKPLGGVPNKSHRVLEGIYIIIRIPEWSNQCNGKEVKGGCKVYSIRCFGYFLGMSMTGTFWNWLGLPNLDYINSFHLSKRPPDIAGVSRLPILGMKQRKRMVILKDFHSNNAWFSLGW